MPFVGGRMRCTVAEREIQVEVAYAREAGQFLVPVKGAPGLTLGEAIERSGILRRAAEIDLAVNKVGIHGKLAKLDQALANGDRVEIYPPLIADPKQATRKSTDKSAAKSAANDAAD